MTTRPTLPRDLWKPAWLVAATTLALLWTLVTFTWWVKLSEGLDLAAIDAIHARRGLEYLGAEFTFDAVLFSAVAVVAGIILARDRSNSWGWLMLGAWALGPPLMTSMAAVVVADAGGLIAVGPPEWWALAFAAGQLIVFAALPASLALFPTGDFSSRRWRQVYQLMWTAWGAMSVLVLLRGGDIWSSDSTLALENPLGISALDWVGDDVFNVFFVVYLIVSLIAVAARYRTAGGEQRLQLKWFFTAVGLFVVLSIIGDAIDWSGAGYLMSAGGVAVVAAIGVAITKYRLYDVDLVINKALVFGALAAFVTAIYAVIVVGIGSIVADSSLALSITATALVAVVFEPVRVRVQKLVNRLVYGSRATPYEVLSDLTVRLADAESGEGLLERMAERLSEGTGAEKAVVWLASPEGLVAGASVPEEATGSVSTNIDNLPGIAIAVEHEGELLGALSVEKPRGEGLTHTELRLCEDLAGSAGLVIRRRRLYEALAARAVELEESRRRLVDAQDTERRRLERSLHDSAQQQVVALKVKLGLARQVAAEECADQASTFIDQMADDAQRAIDQIRSLAQGIYPPLLEAEGLSVAVPALASLSPFETSTNVDIAGRHPLPAEGAVYFCISEALTNAAKHAREPIEVRVTNTENRLTFSVTDGGPGFDPATAERGAGLDNMRDRLDALGGGATISSQPGTSTTVAGWVPTLVAVR